MACCGGACCGSALERLAVLPAPRDAAFVPRNVGSGQGEGGQGGPRRVMSSVSAAGAGAAGGREGQELAVRRPSRVARAHGGGRRR